MPKIALITGAAKRIGAEIARTLHANHYNVIIHYRSSAGQANQLSAELNQQRENSAVALQADFDAFADILEIEKFISQAHAYWGRLDVLINNASAFYPTKIGDVTFTDWDNLLNSNLKMPFFLAQAAANLLSQSQGCIVNITDIHSFKPLKNYSVYSIAKAGLTMMTKSLARELGPEVRVNAVAPGSVVWPEDEVVAENIKQQIVARTALKRQGEPKDIAKAVLFLVRDAEYVTGQTLAVDGGQIFL